MPLFVLAGIVGCAAGSYALQSEARPQRQYLMLLLFMQSGLMGIFASVDVFFFYFFHELALIPTFICIGIWGGRNRQIAAMEIAIYLTLGAMISLVGLLAICFLSGAGSFDMITLKSVLAAAPLEGEAQHVIFAFFLFGFGILVSLFPFYSWAPLGYGAAPYLGGDAPRRGIEEIRLVWIAPGGASPASTGRPPLERGNVLAGPGQRGHHRLCHPGATRPETDDRLQFGDAHGVLFSGSRPASPSSAPAVW